MHDALHLLPGLKQRLVVMFWAQKWLQKQRAQSIKLNTPQITPQVERKQNNESKVMLRKTTKVHVYV